MENVKWVRCFTLSFLFLMISSLPSTRALSQSTAPRLEGTIWRAASAMPVRGGDLSIQFEFRFAEKGEVNVGVFWMVYAIQMKWHYNPIIGQYETVPEYAPL